MALLLIKEDGTGKSDANAYASVADGDAYHEGHLYATAWTTATVDRKSAALVMATRLIDGLFQFDGARANAAQALQWPRLECPDPDDGGSVVTLIWWRGDRVVASNVVPKAVVGATCEMARELLLVDRTAAPAGEGLAAVRSTEYHSEGGIIDSTSTGTDYSKADTRPILSHVAQAMLSKFGAPVSSGSGAVRLVRT
jgi:hypothetical protein